MYVDINDARHATVCEPENLRELRVKTHGVTEAETASTLAASGLGLFDGEHAWLPVEALRAAGAGLGPEWEEGFAGMVAYAESKGWLSQDGLTLRAHLETTY